jgi:sugar lactone lactonase YvrE
MSYRSPRRWLVPALFFAPAIWWIAGCSGDKGTALGPICYVEPTMTDFQGLLVPLAPNHTYLLYQNYVLENRVEVHSIYGNEVLAGSISVHLEPPVEHPPRIVILTGGGNLAFELAPRASMAFRISIFVPPGTSPAEYQGTIDLGTSCSSIPFDLRVYDRPEAPPTPQPPWGPALGYVQGVAVSAAGRVYAADQIGNRIEALDPRGGRGSPILALDEGDSLFYPTGVATGPEGTLFITDTSPESGHYGRVSMFGAADTLVGSWGPPPTEEDPPLPFGQAWSIAVGPNGMAYVVDFYGKHIYRFQAPVGGRDFAYLGSWLPLGTVQAPYGVAVDGDRWVYVSDYSGNAVLKFSPNGTLVRRFGTRGRGPGQFVQPTGVTVDGRGNLFVVDGGNHRVQKFGPDGSFLTAWGALGDTVGEFDRPVDVAVGPDDVVYVSDTGKKHVEIFLPSH